MIEQEDMSLLNIVTPNTRLSGAYSQCHLTSIDRESPVLPNVRAISQEGYILGKKQTLSILKGLKLCVFSKKILEINNRKNNKTLQET